MEGRDAIGNMDAKARDEFYGIFIKALAVSREVHRITRVPPPSTITYAKESTTCITSHLEDACQDWSQHWSKLPDCQEHVEYSAAGEAPVHFTADQVKEAPTGFPSRTTALDGISPGNLLTSQRLATRPWRPWSRGHTGTARCKGARTTSSV